jgi:hypothetical protein
MVFHLQLDTRTLTSHHHTAHHLSLCPNLSVFTDHYRLRLRSPEILLKALHDLYILLACNQALFAFPEYTNTSTEVVFYGGKV